MKKILELRLYFSVRALAQQAHARPLVWSPSARKKKLLKIIKKVWKSLVWLKDKTLNCFIFWSHWMLWNQSQLSVCHTHSRRPGLTVFLHHLGDLRFIADLWVSVSPRVESEDWSQMPFLHYSNSRMLY